MLKKKEEIRISECDCFCLFLETYDGVLGPPKEKKNPSTGNITRFKVVNL